VDAHKLLGGSSNLLYGLSANTRRTKVVALSGGTHRIPEELRRHTLLDDEGGEYSTNLDRNRYGNDDNYLFTVVQYNLRALGLCPCLASVEIIDAKRPTVPGLLAESPPSECICARCPGGKPLSTGFGDNSKHAVSLLPATHYVSNAQPLDAGATAAAVAAAVPPSGAGGPTVQERSVAPTAGAAGRRRESMSHHGGGGSERKGASNAATANSSHAAVAAAAARSVLMTPPSVPPVSQDSLLMLYAALEKCGQKPPPSPFAPGKSGGQAATATAGMYAAVAAAALQGTAAAMATRHLASGGHASAPSTEGGPLVRGDPFQESFGDAVASAAGHAGGMKKRQLFQLDAQPAAALLAASVPSSAVTPSPMADSGAEDTEDGLPVADPMFRAAGATSPLRAPSRQTSSHMALRKALADTTVERDELRALMSRLQERNAALERANAQLKATVDELTAKVNASRNSGGGGDSNSKRKVPSADQGAGHTADLQFIPAISPEAVFASLVHPTSAHGMAPPPAPGSWSGGVQKRMRMSTDSQSLTTTEDLDGHAVPLPAARSAVATEYQIPTPAAARVHMADMMLKQLSSHYSHTPTPANG
jgi:hypothetical protein